MSNSAIRPRPNQAEVETVPAVPAYRPQRKARSNRLALVLSVSGVACFLAVGALVAMRQPAAQSSAATPPPRAGQETGASETPVTPPIERAPTPSSPATAQTGDAAAVPDAGEAQPSQPATNATRPTNRTLRVGRPAGRSNNRTGSTITNPYTNPYRTR